MGKSGPINCGNVNMRGKKYKLLSCRCCECQDFREKMLNKAIAKEMFEDPYEEAIDSILDLVDFWDLVEEDKVWNGYNHRKNL